MGDQHADTGRPMPADLSAGPRVRYHKLATTTRQVSLRNTGVNTLWVSLDRISWFDVASGTSWDDRINVPGFWHCTQVGVTTFVANGLALNHIMDAIPQPLPEDAD